MASKAGRVVIVDATTKTLEAAKVKAEPQVSRARAARATAKKTITRTDEKVAAGDEGNSTKKKALLMSDPDRRVSTAAAERVKKSSKQETQSAGVIPAQKKIVAKSASEALQGQRLRRSRSSEFVVKLRRMTAPEITRARMRAVAYIGVTYVLLGVCTASYALAGIYQASSMSILGMLPEPIAHFAQTTSSLSSGGGSDGTMTTTTTATTDSTTSTTNTSGSDSGTGSGGSISTTSTNSGTSNTTTTSTTGTASTTAGTDTLSPSVLTPAAALRFSGSDPFHDDVAIMVEVADAEEVELALIPHNTLTPYHLGKAIYTTSSNGEWRLTWHTRNFPNGSYDLLARIRNRYGDYNSSRQPVDIFNPTASVTQTTTTITTSPSVNEAVATIENEMVSALSVPATTTLATTSQKTSAGSEKTEDTTVATAGTTDLNAETTDEEPGQTPEEEAAEESARAVEVLGLQISKFKDNLLLLVERFAVAYRAGDTNAAAFMEAEMTTLRNQTIATIKERQMLVDGNYDRLAQELDALIAQEVARIETRERMIVERVGDTVSIDSDNDGVVDYDEANLYHTDPKSADSDNDGFTDGAEIMSGYDPVNPDLEALVVFENPETSGPVREDVVAIASVETARTEDGSVLGARFTGAGLPNSFVTLYVFSTPVVVTVRTGEDGSWSYVFDKELEDGSHTIYVGITDNAGRIVAKSNPFPFVKTAGAFTGAAAVERSQAPVLAQPELISGNVMLLVIALSLTLLGLALIALGAYFTRPREHEWIAQPA